MLAHGFAHHGDKLRQILETLVHARHTARLLEGDVIPFLVGKRLRKRAFGDSVDVSVKCYLAIAIGGAIVSHVVVVFLYRTAPNVEVADYKFFSTCCGKGMHLLLESVDRKTVAYGEHMQRLGSKNFCQP